ncbi:metal-dependent hydrolase [Pontibacter toksunensis]|uniref:Metal-dependent hydrolase n=1 Tax=Pontibacter toksunensis TaxID=1332631 RepID=A0ABW6C0F0_9BACT
MPPSTPLRASLCHTFTNYPFSHSLLFVLGWGFLFALVYWLFRKDIKTSVVLGLLVVSHWLLDLIVHVPDLPLYPGSSLLLGFGLWNSIAGTLLLEGLLFLLGVWLYLRTTWAEAKTGLYSLWALIIFLVLVHGANLFGPPPHSMSAVAWAGQLQWLFVGWAYWADRNRTSSAFRPNTLAG